MLNVLLPMAGKLEFDSEDYEYPKPLVEVSGKTLLEHSLEPFRNIRENKRFIAIMRAEEMEAFNLDYVIRQVIDDPLEIIALRNNTQGALCTAMLAIEVVNNDDPLIITSIDHVIDSVLICI